MFDAGNHGDLGRNGILIAKSDLDHPERYAERQLGSRRALASRSERD